MKVLHLNKQIDRQAWMDLRRSKITGKTSKTIRPLTRGPDKGKIDSAVGFWQLLAGKLAVQKDAEDPKARGDRLEPVALKFLADTLGLRMDYSPGMWLSDDNEDIAITPDGAEDSDSPTWAAEVKCLDSSLHLKYVITAMRECKKEECNPIDLIPNEYAHCYREQVVQYFVVNERLEQLYFMLYDDRIAVDNLTHQIIVVNREEIAKEIEAQKQLQLDALREVDRLIAELTEE